MLPQDALFIKGPVRLTPRQQRIVAYLVDHPDEAVFLSASELGERLNASDATIVRLAQTLGFVGFTELKQHLRGLLLARLDTVTRLERAIRQVDSLESVLTAVMRADLRNLTQTAETVDIPALVSIVKLLARATEVNIVGLRSAHAVAHFLASALRFLGRRVRPLVPGVGDIWSDLSTLGPGSILFAISFPRYTRLTVEVAEAARKNGATVISLTDSLLSPLAAHSQHVLTARFRVDSYVESYVAALSLINALVTGVAFLDRANTMRHLKQMEDLWDEKGVYYANDGRSFPSWVESEPEEGSRP
jgi:DNA-binding MurR/RpiR family transcriptional regulator